MTGLLLRQLQARIRRRASSEDGTAFIEYVILATVAVVVVLGAIQVFFGGVADMWASLTDSLNGASG